MFETPKSRIYTVSEITTQIKQLLETRFFDLTVEGEISNFRPSSTGHWYFTLKDNDAVISAVIFRRQAASAGFIPSDGQKVQIKGRLSLYPQRGQYQIIGESIQASGEGDILIMLEKRKRELAARGLFDASLKKALPRFPRRICVISSPTSAALQDILRVTGRLAPSLNILILPCAVQGEEAPGQIVSQLEWANRHMAGDIIILARGGGSLEDLLPFSEIAVVEAVAASQIPVITGVGHEIDFSLSDFAADVRASTPSAAAEIAVSCLNEALRLVSDFRNNGGQILSQQIEMLKNRLDRFSLQELKNAVDYYLEPLYLRSDDLKEELIRNYSEKLKDHHHKIKLLKELLTASSPENILKMGYSYIYKQESHIPITSSHDLTQGEIIGIKMAEGKASGEIKEIEY